jgi:dolichol-phosphate mannosyltransferase
MTDGNDSDMEKAARALRGPILVLGASGFIGANLLRTLLRFREDVVGTTNLLDNWRLTDIPERHLAVGNLFEPGRCEYFLDMIKPRTIFNCLAYGAYSFQGQTSLIYQTNFLLTAQLLEWLEQRGFDSYVHAGSSSEYGDLCAGPQEEAMLTPNSAYAVSKASCSALIYYYGKKKGLNVSNLRLYSVYGPYEDSSRLVPTLIRKGLTGELPPFVDPDTSRDFIHVDDACLAFMHAALHLGAEHYGESFNIGTGRKTTIRSVAEMAGRFFGIEAEPKFTMSPRRWDCMEWYANTQKAKSLLGFEARITFEQGLAMTADWARRQGSHYPVSRTTKYANTPQARSSLSAVVACYKDGDAIPIMHERLTETLRALDIDYEIIFVNDCSPDDSEEVIRRISEKDTHVVGITHSRNFGSQAAFRSGMEMSTKQACVLMDGDLQDPPEMLKDFIRLWRQGYDVVYGKRVKREEPWHMQVAYKLFYRLFSKFSFIAIPLDAGDFSLLDRTVMQSMMQFSERDLFMRGLRAYAGFKQIGVDYIRPKRKFGQSTNNIFKYVGWAKKGILSFSFVPLNVLSFGGWMLLLFAVIAGATQIIYKLLFPQAIPHGVTTLLLVVTFFGALNVFAISIVGEYIAKIFEEVKARPIFIRRHIVRNGQVTIATQPFSRNPGDTP